MGWPSRSGLAAVVLVEKPHHRLDQGAPLDVDGHEVAGPLAATAARSPASRWCRPAPASPRRARCDRARRAPPASGAVMSGRSRAHHLAQLEQADARPSSGMAGEAGVARGHLGVDHVVAARLGQGVQRAPAQEPRQPRPARAPLPPRSGRRRNGAAMIARAATVRGSSRARRSASRPPSEKPATATGAAADLGRAAPRSAASAEASQSAVARSPPAPRPCRSGRPAPGASVVNPCAASASASGRTSKGVPVKPCRHSAAHGGPRALREKRRSCLRHRSAGIVESQPSGVMPGVSRQLPMPDIDRQSQ